MTVTNSSISTSTKQRRLMDERLDDLYQVDHLGQHRRFQGDTDPTMSQSVAAFPVTWRHADDEQMTWVQDRLHFPDLIPPVQFSLVEEAVDAGITKAGRFYDIPITVHDRHINGYLYLAVVPDELTPAEAALLTARSDEQLRIAMTNMRTTWDTEWLPEIEAHLAWWDAQDPTTASWSALLAALSETQARMKRIWEIHFLLFFPAMLAISQFVDLYEDIFEDAESLAAYKALTGFDTKTVESASDLWTLSRQILASPMLTEVFSTGSAAAVLTKLEKMPEANDFRQAFAGYLTKHGYRADKLSMDYPFWIEDPTPVIANLQDYMLQPDRDLHAEMAERIAQRAAAVADLQTQLAGYPAPIRTEAEFLLQAAQDGSYLKEVHGYWIDYKSCYCVRRVLLEIGRHLSAAGVIDNVQDVFYFYLEELHSLLAQLADRPSALTDPRPMLEERRLRQKRYVNVTPPPQLGAEPDGPPADDPVSRMFFKVEGSAPLSRADPLTLRGHAGSPGVVEGIVKIAYQLKDIEKLAPGDILVAEATAPPWAPVFASVGGVITDTGGPLSHCAVVAREYGIPAVVGVGIATNTLRDGQRVVVDGTQGVVHLFDT